ncbi:hypothetical protein O7614_11295 [Micromonospora sp. WMMD961]|uniref:hypothetical protein n=1 Tax=Micromonospora sp. WMMD961 TaxID=3016100 RepID=UPI002415AEB6|nr:hypothetical protein [Micromonospora sp. WMMD961]MDG4780224.1 hypothetical protein [Micromonospora sp. WMMD961]
MALGVSAAPAVAVREQRQEPAEEAAISIRMLDIPASRVQDPRAQVYIVDHLNPGTTINRRVEVRNTSGEPQKIEFYSGAASVEHNSFTVPEGRTGNELSGWIRLTTATMELDPGERRPVAVEIAVPKKASKGERYAAIWAQVTSPKERTGNVTQIHRVGIRVYLDVGPGGEPPTDFRIDGLAAEPATGEFPVVTAQVTNTGQRALDMTGTLSLSKAAVRAGPFKVTNGVTILPGQSGQVRIEVNQALPAGTWDVEAKLASGIVERTATGKISLPVAAPMTVATSAGPRWLVYTVGGFAALVLLTLGGRHLVRRRRPA